MPINPAMMQALLMRLMARGGGATPPPRPMGGGGYNAAPPEGMGALRGLPQTDYSDYIRQYGLPSAPTGMNPSPRAPMNRGLVDRQRALPGDPRAAPLDLMQIQPPVAGRGPRMSRATPRVRDARSPEQRDMQRMQQRGMAPQTKAGPSTANEARGNAQEMAAALRRRGLLRSRQ